MRNISFIANRKQILYIKYLIYTRAHSSMVNTCYNRESTGETYSIHSTDITGICECIEKTINSFLKIITNSPHGYMMVEFGSQPGWDNIPPDEQMELISLDCLKNWLIDDIQENFRIKFSTGSYYWLPKDCSSFLPGEWFEPRISILEQMSNKYRPFYEEVQDKKIEAKPLTLIQKIKKLWK